MKRLMLVLVALAIVGALTATTVSAEPAASKGQDVAYGAGSFFSTLVYAPFKTSFCVVGAVTSGLALPFGGPDTSGRMATAACGGTWVITPNTLKGKEQVRFVGP